MRDRIRPHGRSCRHPEVQVSGDGQAIDHPSNDGFWNTAARDELRKRDGLLPNAFRQGSLFGGQAKSFGCRVRRDTQGRRLHDLPQRRRGERTAHTRSSRGHDRCERFDRNRSYPRIFEKVLVWVKRVTRVRGHQAQVHQGSFERRSVGRHGSIASLTSDRTAMVQHDSNRGSRRRYQHRRSRQIFVEQVNVQVQKGRLLQRALGSWSLSLRNDDGSCRLTLCRRGGHGLFRW